MKCPQIRAKQIILLTIIFKVEIIFLVHVLQLPLGTNTG